MAGHSDHELKILAHLDAHSDINVDFMLERKNKHGMRRSRARSFTNEHDKNEYYRLYNEQYELMLKRKIFQAKKFLRSEGYVVMEKE